MTKFNNEEERQKELFVNELGVFELRGVARQLGVPSPTTKKREELIALILEASRNGQAHEENVSKRGRPFKKLNFLDSITTKIAPERTIKMDFDSVIQFRQDPLGAQEVESETYFFEGIVRKFNEDARLIDYKTNELVYIPKEIAYYKKLVSGDKITIETKKLLDRDGFLALNIIQINNQPAQDYQPSLLDLGEEIIDERTIDFDNGKVHLGRRNLYALKEKFYENDIFEKFYNKCNEKNIKVIVLGVNTSFEDQIKFKSVGIVDNYTTVYGTDNTISFNKIVDVIVYANNLLMRGKEVLIFVPDIIDLLRCADTNFGDSGMEGDDAHNVKTVIIAQKLLAFAKSYKGNHSGTLVMCYNEGDLEDKFLANDIFKISKKI